MRNGVEPPEPARPTGLTSTTLTPNWSSTARRSATPRTPPMSRWAVLPRPYFTGKTSFGVKKRNAFTRIATISTTPTTMSVGWSEPRYSREPAYTATATAAISLAIDRGRPGTTIEYRADTTTMANTATGTEGIEKPRHPPMMVTS